MGASSYKFQRRASAVISWQLRLLSALQLLAGAGYIAFACVLQWPPGDVMTAGLWVIGCLTILAALLGFVAGCNVRCCLPVYATLAVLATLGQTGFVLYLFIAPDKAVAKLSDYQSTQNGTIKDNLHEIVYTGRWVLLGVLGAQLLAIVLALIMRCCSRGRTYLAFQEEADYEKRRAAAESQLDKLRSKVLAGEGDAESNSKKVINITAVSGSAAGAAAAAALEQQQQRDRALLFASGDDGKLDEAEAGKIGSMRTTSSDAPAQQLPMSAWPSASQPPAQQTRSFKATWSKATMPQ